MSDTVGDLVAGYLAEQCTVVLDATDRLRAHEPIVHSTRVGVRRARSTLRTFGALFDPTGAAWLDTELRWWAQLLGAVRDVDVLEERMHELLADLPPELVVGPVESRITGELAQARQAGWSALLSGLAGERYAALEAALQHWREDPPQTAAADEPSSEVRRYATRAGKKFRRRLRTGLGAYAAHEPDARHLLHDARKAGKRHRYALEAAEPLLGEQAAHAVEQRKEMQDALGHYQDACVGAEFLREIGVRTGTEDGHNGFTYGLLCGAELHRQQHLMDELQPLLGHESH